MKTRIGLFVAMDKELDLLIKNFKYSIKKINSYIEFYLVDYDDDIELIIHKSGIGTVNAAISATLMISYYKPSFIIVSGVCGGLGIQNQNWIHITENVTYHDVWCGDDNDNKYGQVQGLPVDYLLTDKDDEIVSVLKEKFETPDRKVYCSTTLTGNWFVDSKKKARDIIQIYNRDASYAAVDMEIGAIAQTCYILDSKIKLMAVKVISDAVLNEGCKKYSEFWDNAGNELYDIVTTVIDYYKQNL